MVYAGEDLDADNDTVILTHSISGADYTTVAVDSVTMTVEDNDIRGITGTPETLAVPIGSNRTFVITLATQPKGNVKVLVSLGRSDRRGRSGDIGQILCEFHKQHLEPSAEREGDSCLGCLRRASDCELVRGARNE